MRDLRDPTILGEAYLLGRSKGLSIEATLRKIGELHLPDYDDEGFISSNPRDHHSRTPQNLGSLDDGGAS